MEYNQATLDEHAIGRQAAAAMSQQRYEKEIEEILKQAGETPQAEQPTLPPTPSGPPKEPRRRRIPSRGFSLRQVSFGYKPVLLSGIVLLLLTLFWSQLFVFLIGLALLIAGYVMYYRAPRGGSAGGGAGPAAPKMWRGRRIESDDC